jgi:hypothetical protein
MKPAPANRKSKDILRALMDPSQPDAVPWSSTELRAILDHQLAASLIAERARLAEITHSSLDQISALIETSSCQTFGDLLLCTSPHIPTLALLKDFAKASLIDEGDLPREVARVLYIMAILRGRLSGTHLMTSLDSASIERETRRCLTYAWLPDSVRQSLRTWLERLKVQLSRDHNAP